MRLNGWQRLGVVASIIWFFVGGFIGNKEALENAAKETSAHVDICVAANKMRLGEYGPYDQVWTPCTRQYEPIFSRNAEGHWWAALIVGLGPIPFAWLLGWAIIAVGRWIARGFRRSPSAPL